MNIKQNHSLKKYNTFNIEAKADYFVELSSEADVFSLINSDILKNNEILIIGGGCNILFVNDFKGLVVKVANKGIEKIKEDKENVYLRVAAGEDWDSFVEYCVNNNYYGAENLSLIPGCVGSCVVQNIGAYGVELKDVFYELTAYDIFSGDKTVFDKQKCEFGYRKSIFKNKTFSKYLIFSVVFKLSKKQNFVLDYGNIKQEIEKLSGSKLNIRILRDVVCKIRNSKLPDITQIGSAGSFFKNPFVSSDKFFEIKKKYPEIVAYKIKDNLYKLSAAWMVDKCGWKGKRFGDAGVYEKQALVIVNYGNATGKEIYNLSKEIQKSVFEKFNIQLQPEVIII